MYSMIQLFLNYTANKNHISDVSHLKRSQEICILHAIKEQMLYKGAVEGLKYSYGQSEVLDENSVMHS